MLSVTQGTLDGILIGGIYAVLAIGLTLLFGVVRIVNFAHGAFVMAGSYLTLLAYRHVGLDPYFALPLVCVAFFALGAVFYLVFLHRLAQQSMMSQALFTIAVGLVLTNGSLAIFGPDLQAIRLPYSLETVRFGSVSLEVTRLVAFGCAVVVTGALYWLLWRTDFGVQVRAAAADPGVARLMGIRTTRVRAIATGLSLACAGVAGAILLPILYVAPESGDQFVFLAFIIIVLGGMGSFFGALVGGMLIGITQSLGSTYFDGSVAQLLTFLIFVLVLLLRPEGIFVRRTA